MQRPWGHEESLLAAEEGRSQGRGLRRKQRAVCTCRLTLQPGCSQFDDWGSCSKYSRRYMRPDSSTWPSKIQSQCFTQKCVLIWPWCCVSNFLELPSESDHPSPWVPTCYERGAHCLLLELLNEYEYPFTFEAYFFPSFIRYFPAYLGLCKIYSQLLFFAVWMSSVCA